jgi:chromosome partitioning protein
MTRILAFANQKGGSGKTTSAINVAAGLARSLPAGGGVLLVDCDAQANATAVLLGLKFAAGAHDEPTVYEALMGKAPAAAAVRAVTLAARGQSPAATLDVLPAHLRLAVAELELVAEFQREGRLRDALAPLRDAYSYIVIDSPPALGLLTMNVLMAATEVIIPVDPGFLPLIGIGYLQHTIEKIRRGNPGLRIGGVLPTLDTNTALARSGRAALRQQFDRLVLPAIPRRASIAEAIAANQDIFAHEPLSHAGAAAYALVVKEIIRRGP